MKIIGLTGGIATGKSTVVRHLQNQGYSVIDADKIARKILNVGTKGLQAVIQAFGSHLLYLDGSLNRSQLGAVIFNDAKARKQLESITHPLIFEEITRQLTRYQQEQNAIVFIDMPLLYEVGYDDQVDEVWVVYTHPARQLERLQLRDDLAKEAAQQRIESQWPIQEKADQATIIIDNNGTVEQTYEQVDQALKRLS